MADLICVFVCVYQQDHYTVKTGVSVHLFINDTPRGANLNYGF